VGIKGSRNYWASEDERPWGLGPAEFKGSEDERQWGLGPAEV
jgi:hypothetical protein